MLRYIWKRLITGIVTIFGLAVFIFVLVRVIPGDPARLALGPRASQEAVDALRKELYLDQSLPKQFLNWFNDVLHWDWGRSTVTNRNVTEDIRSFLPVTVEPVLLSGILLFIFVILLGLLSARFHDTLIDNSLRVFAYVSISLPSFVWAVLFLLIFGHFWKILPVFGRLSAGIRPPLTTITGVYYIDGLLTGNFIVAWDCIKHSLLPAIAMAMGAIFQDARLLRGEVIKTSSKEYISVANGYGIPRRKMMFKYLFKPSFSPVFAIMGLEFAAIFGAAFLVEATFNISGFARYGINAMINKDLNAVSAVVIILGIIFFICNIGVDIVNAWIDPRIRLQ